MIELRNITKVYKSGFSKEKTAVSNVSFTIEEGKITGLMGNSGCGKSTIAKLILRIIKPTQGDILFREKSILNLSKKENIALSKKIQVVFQHPQESLNPHMTILNNLLEPIKIHKLYDKETSMEVIRESLGLVNLSPKLLNRYPATLSGGENQRIMIARSFITKSEFLVLDEPSSMLDMLAQGEVMKLLYKLQKKNNLTYLYISHDLEMVRYFCDNIIIMNDGSIVEKGEVKEVIENPKEEYTKHLIKNFELLAI